MATASTPATTSLAAKIAAATPKQAPEQRVFYGEFPETVSYLTPLGTPVHFYRGFHITTSKEVAEFCNELPGVQEITGSIKIEEVPTPPVRNRQRMWAAAEKTEITPAELLQRVVSSRDITTAAPSNGG